MFEAELLDLGIELINSRPYRPQTNGKLERFHRNIKDEIPYHNRLSAYVEWYNEERLYWSLDIANYQIPENAFFDTPSNGAPVFRTRRLRFQDYTFGTITLAR